MEIFYYLQTLLQFQISNGVMFILQKNFQKKSLKIQSDTW